MTGGPATLNGRTGLLLSIGRRLLVTPDNAARALVLRDVDAWLRLEFLGVVARTGVAEALAAPSTADEIAARAGVRDVELLRALLEVGVALREVRRRGDRYRIRGRRLRAVVGGAEDLAGLVEEVAHYDAPIYAALGEHLAGAPERDYDAGLGDVIARASRLAEPLLEPVVRAVVGERRPERILDVGCGTGVYLRHALAAAPTATATGIDLDAAALAVAREVLGAEADAGRCTLRQADLRTFDAGDGYDVALLLNNIYYWPPQERRAALGRLREALAPGGTAIVATATPAGPAFNRHLDLVLRVTAGSWRLPTADELRTDMAGAGFGDSTVATPVPGTGLAVAIGSVG